MSDDYKQRIREAIQRVLYKAVDANPEYNIGDAVTGIVDVILDELAELDSRLESVEDDFYRRN